MSQRNPESVEPKFGFEVRNKTVNEVQVERRTVKCMTVIVINIFHKHDPERNHSKAA